MQLHGQTNHSSLRVVFGLGLLLGICSLLPLNAVSAEIGSPQLDTDSVISAKKIANPCGKLEVNFNDKCRSFKFFRRFLTPEAELGGVAGPGSKSKDTGVVVVEALPNGVIQWLYILPDKHISGAPYLTGRQYRAEYPIVAIRTAVVGQDPDGFMHTFIANQGMLGPSLTSPAIAFGIQSWVLRTQTASGYIEKYPDGTMKQMSASTGEGGQYCATAASGTRGVVTGACMVADVLASAVSGIVAGSGVFLIGQFFSAGLALPESAGAGIAIGSVVFGTGIAVGTVMCSLAGDFAGTLVNDYCKGGPNVNSTAGDIKLLPLLPDVPVKVPTFGKCPDGLMAYTGPVVSCGGSTGVINNDGGIEVTIKCTKSNVTNMCVVP